MQIILTILVFFLIFSLLILIHEFGHFFAAKRAGVKVEEFGMGLPPRIWGVKKGETLYSINWIPFGGFVRMLGEDGKSTTSKRSFKAKSPLQQLWIVSAGVVMNFVLAILLLTIGFWIGIEPLWTSQDEFFEGVRNGEVEVYLARDYAEDTPVVSIPRLRYVESEDSLFTEVLKDGDVIVTVDGENVLTEEHLTELLVGKSTVEMEIYRPGYFPSDTVLEYQKAYYKPMNLDIPVNPPLVSQVIPGSPAEEAGLQSGDFLVSIGGEGVRSSSQVAELNNPEGAVYEVMRIIKPSRYDFGTVESGTELIEFEVVPDENGLIGVMLSDSVDPLGNLSLYQDYYIHEFGSIQKEQYGLLEAPLRAVSESWRLGKYTAVMFLDVFKGFLEFEEVPAGVSGPVGIAQMTFFAVQDGLGALLRFVALLSLSLGVVNILPIPALDGGRAVFILYRMITGKRPHAAMEQWIHLSGFVLLLSFIAYVTFNDILNLF